MFPVSTSLSLPLQCFLFFTSRQHCFPLFTNGQQIEHQHLYPATSTPLLNGFTFRNQRSIDTHSLFLFFVWCIFLAVQDRFLCFVFVVFLLLIFICFLVFSWESEKELLTNRTGGEVRSAKSAISLPSRTSQHPVKQSNRFQNCVEKFIRKNFMNMFRA